MEKTRLSELVRTCYTDSPEDAQAVVSLKDQFPYCQFLQVLAAKVSDQHALPSRQAILQMAAVYVNDRSVLKDIMTSAVAAPVVEATAQREVQQSPIENLPIQVPASAERPDILKTITTVDLADAIMDDLQKLHASKHNFEMLFADDSTVSLQIKGELITSKEKTEPVADQPPPVQPPPAPTSGRRRKAATEAIIEEIKSTKEELAPESERQKEQIVIIDHFIKNQPSISAPIKHAAPLTDLNSVKSGDFSENIISETLVEILLKQGKKERAIEVLKKLIWKYPQKKAYFASQIDALKK